LLAVLLSLVDPVQAIITGSDIYDHGSLHPDRAPMLENVGQLGSRQSGSAVYLGQRWILTANHAYRGRHADLVYLAGKVHRLLPATAVQLKNPAGTGGGKADLLMVQLATAPDLPALKINEQAPFIAERIVMVGCGATHDVVSRKRFLTETQELNHTVKAHEISGEAVDGVATPRWGENEVAERNMKVGIAGASGSTLAFATIKQAGDRPRNAQGGAGDSGGGVFVKRGDTWKLSGIMLSVLQREDLDVSGTFSADLSVYREQIESTIPEPSVGGLLMFAGLFACGRRRR
ncbi:MAG: hypothetical protein ACI9UA_005032, partial [Pseudoalteromonas tetraodonis]